VGNGKAPHPRHTSPAGRRTERWQVLTVALELLIEALRLLRELLGG
jgi:hypothetical protein